MVVYKIFCGQYTYIGSTTRSLKLRIYEHNYRLGDPPAHEQYAHSKLYRKLRELGVTKICSENCEKICDGNLLEEQQQMDLIPMEYSLNSVASIRKRK